MNRVADVSQALPARKRRLAFEYHASEQASINHIRSKGAEYAESALRVRRDLSQEISAPPALPSMAMRHTKMDDRIEQQSYIDVYNEAMVSGRSQIIVPAAMTLSDWRNFLRRVILPRGTVILACQDRQIIGSVSCFWDEEENQRMGRRVGTVDNVFVREGWRRRGIAGRMMCAGFDYFKAKGLEFARLNVNSDNEGALKLYESLGFVTVHSLQMFVLDLA